MAKTNSTTKKATPKAAMLKALKARYPHITKIVALGVKDNPIRVVIRCTEDGCTTDREIATQDAFQVTRCQICQMEFAKARRRKQPVAA